MFRSIEDDLIDYLAGLTEDPDSVISDKFNESRFIVGAMREFVDLPDSASGVQTVVRISTGQANPKWIRDTYFVDVLVIGQDRSKYKECEEEIHNLSYTLLGSNVIYVGNRAYVQFNNEELPHFAGYFEDSMPLFSTTMNFVVEGLEDEYNRKALC